ncbi:hypothetical protein A2U01_0114729, partial [Trifolium medium]|nr:hypothetical protein [Trifolium medium]
WLELTGIYSTFGRITSAVLAQRDEQ